MKGARGLSEVEAIIREFKPKGLARTAPSDVVTAEWVRLKCQYGCGGYGQCLTCPPHSPTPEQTRRVLDGYETAYVLWWGDNAPGRKELAQIERRVFLAGCYKALMLACGPCDLCDSCPLDLPCRHPHEARPSMEACGIDVYQTAHRAGLPLKVVTTRQDTPNYYSLLLVE